MAKIDKCHCELTRRKANILAAAFSGIFFSVGWWCLIDANSTNKHIFTNHRMYYVPGIFSTFAFFVTNMVPMQVIRQDFMYQSKCPLWFARLVLFVGFFISFSSLIGAFFVYINDFAVPLSDQQWAGVAVLLQNLLIFVATFLYRFGIKEEEF